MFVYATLRASWPAPTRYPDNSARFIGPTGAVPAYRRLRNRGSRSGEPAWDFAQHSPVQGAPQPASALQYDSLGIKGSRVVNSRPSPYPSGKKREICIGDPVELPSPSVSEEILETTLSIQASLLDPNESTAVTTTYLQEDRPENCIQICGPLYPFRAKISSDGAASTADSRPDIEKASPFEKASLVRSPTADLLDVSKTP